MFTCDWFVLIHVHYIAIQIVSHLQCQPCLVSHARRSSWAMTTAALLTSHNAHVRMYVEAWFVDYCAIYAPSVWNRATPSSTSWIVRMYYCVCMRSRLNVYSVASTSLVCDHSRFLQLLTMTAMSKMTAGQTRFKHSLLHLFLGTASLSCFLVFWYVLCVLCTDEFCLQQGHHCPIREPMCHIEYASSSNVCSARRHRPPYHFFIQTYV